MRVAGRWPALVARGDPDAYVRRVVYNQHISWWRRDLPPTARLADQQATMPDPGDAVVAVVAVQQALARLIPRQRAVLILRYFEDLTEARTAEILGVSVGTVKVRPATDWPGCAFWRPSCRPSRRWRNEQR